MTWRNNKHIINNEPHTAGGHAASHRAVGVESDLLGRSDFTAVGAVQHPFGYYNVVIYGWGWGNKHVRMSWLERLGLDCERASTWIDRPWITRDER